MARRKERHIVEMARIRIETVVVEVEAASEASAERKARAKADQIENWHIRPFDPTQYRSHVERMFSADDLRSNELPPDTPADKLLDDEGDYAYVLLRGDLDAGEGKLILQPWLVVDQPELLSSDIARDWLCDLEKLGLSHLADRVDDLLSGSPVKPSDRIMLSPRRPKE